MTTFDDDQGSPWQIIHIANACFLLRVHETWIMTDPWFSESQHFSETPILQVTSLPELAAIVGGHWAKDHWDMIPLRRYPYKSTTQILTSDRRMTKRAGLVGFSRTRTLKWGERVVLSPRVWLESIPEHTFSGRVTSNYALCSEEARIFVGTKTLQTHAARAYLREWPPFDVVIGAIHGVHQLDRPLAGTTTHGRV